MKNAAKQNPSNRRDIVKSLTAGLVKAITCPDIQAKRTMREVHTYIEALDVTAGEIAAAQICAKRLLAGR